MRRVSAQYRTLHGEQAALGCVIWDRTMLPIIREFLRPDYFGYESDWRIFEAMCTLEDRGEDPSDYLLLIKELERQDVHPGDAKGAVDELVNAVSQDPEGRVKAANAAAYAREVLEAALRDAHAQLASWHAERAAYGPTRAEAIAGIAAEESRIADIERRLRGETQGKNGGQLAYFPIMTDAQIENLTPAHGIVGDILFEDTIAYLFGDSDTWKTFIAISMSLSMATGLDWLGRKVVKAPVVYVAAEGARGIGQRVKAWKLYHEVSEQTDFFTVPMPINLLDNEAVARLILSIRAVPKLAEHAPGLIVFDTLARSMDGGDENGTSEANQVTAAAGVLKATFGCCVLILHHNGKDASRGMRGNSAYRNNADTVIKVSAPAPHNGERRRPGDPVALRSEKAKDVDAFDDITLTTVVHRWATEEGAITSSLVVVAADAMDATAAQIQQSSLTKRQEKALETLYTAQTPLNSTEWQQKADLARRTFYDALAVLRDHGYIVEHADGRNKVYSITSSGLQQIPAKVREACELGATAPTAPNDESKGSSSGSSTAIAPIDGETAGIPEISSDGIGAADEDTLYALAPSHLCSKTGGAHEYREMRTADFRRICVKCDQPEVRQGLGVAS